MESLVKAQGCDSTWRALQFTNYVFDVSVSDIFTTLGAGGTICMASTANLLSDLAHCINMMEVTHMFLTPTVAKLISPKDVPNVKVLFVGGESLAQDVVSRWAAEVDMRQGYGPTEVGLVIRRLWPELASDKLFLGICFLNVWCSTSRSERKDHRQAPRVAIGIHS
jgi:non-ribosomal peptide synthetase component F